MAGKRKISVNDSAGGGGNIDDALRSDKRPDSYTRVKEQLKQAVERTEQDSLRDDTAEIAIEVIEEDIAASQPMKQAFIAEHLFRKTIEDAIPCGISAIDNQGRQIYVNRTFCDMLGWDEKALLGSSYPYVYWDAKDIQKNRDAYSSLVTTALPPNGIELLFLRKNGEKFWGWVLGAPLYNSDGESAGHLFSIVDISRRKEAEDILKQFSTQLVDARERERQLISQELHDSIGGRLAGIKYGLEKTIRTLGTNSRQAATALNNLLKVVKSAINETRRISKNLHPSVLDDLGLKAAIRDLIGEFRGIYPATAVSCSLEIDETGFSDPLKILVYRVCQEALTNIGKHSRADQVALELHMGPTQAVLTIKDNGIGLPADPLAGEPVGSFRFGLLNMRERLELAGGRLEVRSERDKGVHLRAVMPLS